MNYFVNGRSEVKQSPFKLDLKKVKVRHMVEFVSTKCRTSTLKKIDEVS